MAPEPCLGSARLSQISAGKPGWGPSKVVSTQGSGFFAASGDGEGVSVETWLGW